MPILVFIIVFNVSGVGSANNHNELIRISSNSSGTTVCPGDGVTFVCTTTNSSIIAWCSDKYIGCDGIRLELTANDQSIQRSQLPGVTASANLINTSNDGNGAIVLISELNLIVKGIPNFSVTCLNVGRELNKSIEIDVSGVCKTSFIVS